MATTNSTGYGGGAGGKFPKKPSRRPQTTPYDRPPTAHRNTGWLSRIVEPASKLISSTAHKLFSSVLRNRLLPPPDNGVDPSENQLGDVTTDDSPRTQEGNKNEGNTHNNGSVTDGVAELEHVLKQKMFTRSEIDRIAVLLQSRTVDKSGIAGQSSFDLRPCEPPAGHSCLDKLDSGVVCENNASPSEVPQTDLTPAVRSKVNHDDDIASPAELAKTYMGSRSRIESPSVLARCNQAVREETHTLGTFQSHRAGVPAVQTPFSTPGTSQNGFVIPRSQGRSALYSMARTPYSRVLPTDNKALKRRCSVLENDSGVVGPIRRTRQKHNLLYSKALAQSSSRTTSEQGETSLYYFSKSQEDKGEKGKPVSSSHMSSKSIKSIDIGNKILQEIEKMTPPKKMSAYEERLELYDDVRSNGFVSPLINEGKRSLDASSVKSNGNLLPGNPLLPHANKADISLYSELKPSSNLGLKNTPMDFSILAEIRFAHRSPPDPIMNKKTEFSVPSIKQITTLVSDKVVIPASTIGFGLRSDKVSSASFLSSSVMESQQTNSVFASSTGATDAGIKSPGSNIKSNGAVDVLTNSGVSATRVGGDAIDCATAISGSSNNLTSSAAFPSFQSGLPFKGSSIASDSTVMVSSGAASAVTSSFTIASSRFGASTTSSTNNQLQTPPDVSSRSIFGDQILPSKTASTSTIESMPSQPTASGSSSLAVSFGVNQSGCSTSVSSFNSSSIFGSSSSGFSSVATSGSTNSASTDILGGNMQPNSSPVLASGFNNSSPGLTFGASSASTHSSSASSGFALGTTSISAPANGSSARISFGASSSSAAPPFSSGSSVFAFKTSSVSAPANGSSAGVPFVAFSAAAAVGSSSSVFAFGVSSSSASPSAPSSTNLFGASSSASATPASIFSFASAASAPAANTPQASQPAFGGGSSIFAFGSTASPPSSSGFGQTNMPFSMASAPAPSGANPFQLGSQQNQPAAPNNPFQTSDNSNGGGFSLGASGNDKSKRRIVKINRARKK